MEALKQEVEIVTSARQEARWLGEVQMCLRDQGIERQLHVGEQGSQRSLREFVAVGLHIY